MTVEPNTSIADLKVNDGQSMVFQVCLWLRMASLLGIVTSRDIRFETHLDRPVSTVMTPKEKLVTVTESATHRKKCLSLMHKHRIEKVLMVDNDFHLTGPYTQ